MTRKKPSVSETIVALYFALEEREMCEVCEGQGLNWIEIDGEAESDPCECTILANETLERYRERYQAMLPLYVMEGADKEWWKKGNNLREMAKEELKEKHG